MALLEKDHEDTKELQEKLNTANQLVLEDIRFAQAKGVDKNGHLVTGIQAIALILLKDAQGNIYQAVTSPETFEAVWQMYQDAKAYGLEENQNTLQ